MEDLKQDSRFAHIGKDPRFRGLRKKERKVKIDQRFKGMFNDGRFKLKYSVDKRGRPIHTTTNENLKKYYDISDNDESDEDEKDDDDGESKTGKEENKIGKQKDSTKNASQEVKPKRKQDKSDKELSHSESEDEQTEEEGESDEESDDIDVTGGTDYARGEGQLSSSEDEDFSEEEDVAVELPWNEMDHDAPIVTETSRRLAVCNMDWDRIKAQDLIVVFNSFKPTTGFIKSVHIYPSEFGSQRMKEEDLKGPKELVTIATDDDERRNENEQHKENLRIYQLNRLKYYYGVVVCDSRETANHIYENCDGIEYEGSSNKLDLRFIPDDMTFDQKPKSEVFDVPDVMAYKATDYISSALQQSKVNLTWDETDPDRVAVMQRKFTKDDIDTLDVQDYLASDSDNETDPYAGIEGPNDDGSDVVEDEETQIQKYRDLLNGIQDTDKAQDNDLEMEISWEPGLKETTRDLVRKSQDKTEDTPWETYLKKSREKNKKKKDKRKNKNKQPDEGAISDDDVPGGIDIDDPYFKEELDKMKETDGAVGDKKKKRKKKKNRPDLTPEEVEELKQREAELALLMSDDEDNKKHFNLRDIMEEESQLKGKKKKKHRQKMKEKMAESKLKKTQHDDFQMNVVDPRFSELYRNPLFNLDPTAPEFKQTNAIDQVIEEKLKRRTKEMRRPRNSADDQSSPSKKLKLTDSESLVAGGHKDVTLATLIKSVKAKTKFVQDKKKLKKSL